MKMTFVHGVGVLIPAPQISISYLSASIKASGRHEASLIDCFLRRDKTGYVLGRIAGEKPDVVGFSVMSVSVSGSLVIAAEIKKRHPGMKIVFGGPHAILRPSEIIGSSAVDAVCIGEGEDALGEYLDALSAGGGRETGLAGFWFRDSGGRVTKNPQRELSRDLDRLPYPDWDIWDVGLYGLSYMYVMASRGCPLSCTYCCARAIRERLCGDRPQGFYRSRSAANVAGEIKRNVARYGFGGYLPLIFCDSIFGLDRRQFEEFTDLFVSEGFGESVPWRCMLVANGIKPDLVRRAKSAGCYAMDMGLEHPDEDFRFEKLNKRVTDEDLRVATGALAAEGMPYELYMMIGYKGETFFRTLANIRKARRLGSVFLFIFMPLPDSELWDEYQTVGCGRGASAPDSGVELKEAPLTFYRFALAWCVKILNHCLIAVTACRIHGLGRMCRVVWRVLGRLGRIGTGLDLLDACRLVSYNIQQYSFLPRTRGAGREGFYGGA